MLIVNVVGARPQFIKAGPVSKALAEAGVHEVLVDTGQHYDPLLADSIMRDVGLRPPDVNLGVGSGSHAEQTARILEGVEALLVEREPDAVLIYGDTNSTLATALAGSKLGVFVGHVEAGLRSFNRVMPEEINRVVADHVSDLLLAPTETAMSHLTAEGLESKAILTGDVMVDALLSIDLDAVETPDWALEDGFYAATIHRAENTDDAERLRAILETFDDLDKPVHLLTHPRLRARLNHGEWEPRGSLRLEEPLPYAEMLATLRRSSGLFTDSGGLQKEAFILGIPCVTIRTETEWPETLEGGWNVLSGPGEDLTALAHRELAPERGEPFGAGRAALSIVESVLDELT